MFFLLFLCWFLGEVHFDGSLNIQHGKGKLKVERTNQTQNFSVMHFKYQVIMSRSPNYKWSIIFFVFQRNLIKMGEENILNLNWNNFGDNLSSLVKELICQQEFLEFYGIERNKFGGGLICGYFCWKQCSLFNKPWCADKTKNVHALLPFFSLTPPPPLELKFSQ